MEERYDVLNEKGEYTGKTETRDICHKEGLWHRAVAIFVINSKNQLLLQKRSAKKKMWPNTWDVTAGGHVLANELGYQAVIRETKEELGEEIDRKDLIFIGSSTSTNIKGDIINKHFNEYYVVIKDIDEKKLKLQEDEVSEVKWMEKDEIIRRVKNKYEGITDKEGCWEYLVKYYELSELKNK